MRFVWFFKNVYVSQCFTCPVVAFRIKVHVYLNHNFGECPRSTKLSMLGAIGLSPLLGLWVARIHPGLGLLYESHRKCCVILSILFLEM